MTFPSLWLQMWGFVLTSYLLSLSWIFGLVLLAWRRYRRAIRQLAACEQHTSPPSHDT